MQLPGRLKSTTLGDLLGTLHRARATGTLELVSPLGRVHRVYLDGGRVYAVDAEGGGAPLADVLRQERAVDEETLRRSLAEAMVSRRLHGEVLVRDFAIDKSVVDAALRRQIRLRLEALERLPDARVTFRVAVRPPRGALRDAPLDAREFLAGRRRARERSSSHRAPDDAARHAGAPAMTASSTPRALHVLGLHAGADREAIKRAYRALARRYHPDLHPNVSETERRDLARRFAEVTEAYRALSA
jgi:hypothetical protein